MKTMLIKYHRVLGGVYDGMVVKRDLELVADPIPLEQAKAHLELGGSVVALRDGVSEVRLDGQYNGLIFIELWADVQWHVLVREL